jgi:hypothetical protein
LPMPIVYGIVSLALAYPGLAYLNLSCIRSLP